MATSVPVQIQNVTYWAQTDPWGRVFLQFRCTICGDATQKLCANPTARASHWATTYAGLHPPTPHTR